MGNYVIEAGNYVIATPSELGNYKIVDNHAPEPPFCIPGRVIISRETKRRIGRSARQ
jgi:hypothetical protein